MIIMMPLAEDAIHDVPDSQREHIDVDGIDVDDNDDETQLSNLCFFCGDVTPNQNHVCDTCKSRKEQRDADWRTFAHYQ